MYQPVGSAVFVGLPAVLERVLKFSVAAVPSAVSETLPVPVSAEAVGIIDGTMKAAVMTASTANTPRIAGAGRSSLLTAETDGWARCLKDRNELLIRFSSSANRDELASFSPMLLARPA